MSFSFYIVYYHVLSIFDNKIKNKTCEINNGVFFNQASITLLISSINTCTLSRKIQALYFVCLFGVFSHTREFSLIRRRHNCQWRAANFACTHVFQTLEKTVYNTNVVDLDMIYHACRSFSSCNILKCTVLKYFHFDFCKNSIQ